MHVIAVLGLPLGHLAGTHTFEGSERTALGQPPLELVMPATLGAAPVVKHRLSWMCHCMSAPPMSGTLSRATVSGSMYMALTSFFEPSGCGWYTRLSGRAGSRVSLSLIQSQWM